MPRPVSIDDFMRLATVGDPQFSPDSRHVALVKSHIDRQKNKSRSEIWIVPKDAGEPRRFTSGDHNDSSPRWSPDGAQIAFLSDRQKPKAQIYLLPTDGGEARPLTKLEKEGDISDLKWSPDGTKIAFLFRATPGWQTKEATEKREKDEMPPPPRHHTRLFYRMDGFGYWDETFHQVWVADAKTGKAKQLTDGPWSCYDLAWSPDSQTLAFGSNRRDDSDILNTYDDIYTVPAEGGELTVVPSPLGPKESLSWSPDGKWFSWVGSPDPEETWGIHNSRVFVLPAEGGDTARDLTGPSDLSVGHETLSDVHATGGPVVRWNADSSALFFVAGREGDTRLGFVPINGGDVVLVSPEKREVGGFDIAPDGRAAVTLASSTSAQELYLLTEPGPNDSGVRAEAKTRFNAGFAEEVALIAPEEPDIQGPGGRVPAWILKPAGLEAGGRVPLVLYVHGGPHAQYGNTLFHELQWLAAQGYAVLYTNPRGSKGYGEAHTKAIRNAWGTVDWEDVQAAADWAAAQSFVDADRMAIMGGSYGGYMTAWAVGHTDRFACAIADRLVGNLVSMAGTCDFPWKPEGYWEGNTWANPETLWKHSPLAYAGNITTPLLIIHSDGDLRCPQGQAEELFYALRIQRKTVEFVRYPAETSHGMSRNGPPNLRLDRLQRNLAWLDRFLKPNVAPSA